MRFAFFAADPVHESVPLFASLLEARGHQVDVIDDGRHLLEDQAYDAAWYRFSPHRERRLVELSWEAFLALEAAGVPCVNSSLSLMLARNKFLTACRFAAQGLPQPKTALLSEDEPGFPGPYIVKPVFGALSRGIAVCESLDAAWVHAMRQGPCVIQEYLEDAYVLRVFASPKRALAVRDKREDSGTVYYAPARAPYAAEQAACALACQMVGAVGGELMGVDVLVHEDELYALEVNGGFGFAPDWQEAAAAIVAEFERVGG
jgi:glutathione synthase/RimK-type ligase-like ATP-grasp enzyme